MKKLTTIAAGCGILATLALAGCSPASDATPTESPTAVSAAPSESATPTATAVSVQPYVTEPPTTAAEALQYASTADNEFRKASYALLAEPTLTVDLEALAAGEPVESIRANAAKLIELGGHLAGSSTFEVNEGASFTQDTQDQTGTAIPFGMVTLKGCVDYSKVSSVNSEGVSKPFNEPTRVLQTTVVVYAPSDGRWVVTQSDTDEPVTTC